MSDILFSTATGIAEQIRDRKISSSELLSELRRSCTESLVNAGQRRGRRR